MRTFIVIAAVDYKTNGIGKSGKLIWNIKNDMAWFRHWTADSNVIMGRKTFESIGKPLPNRKNIVISRTL